jgi:cysteine desulfurase
MTVYLDYNATTPLDPAVAEALADEYSRVGNASSIDHVAGADARARVEAARAEVADLIGAEPEEIIFTSGATEADNIAVLGTLAKSPGEIVVSAVEHPAVLEPAHQAGRALTAPVNADGIVDVAALMELVTPATVLVSVMAVNNETGAIQPLAEIGALCAERDVAFHVDAAQAAGRIALDVKALNIAMLSISAHKMYGPQGVGALYIRRRPRTKLAPITFGGGHERGLRPGTLNVPGSVALGVAARLVRKLRSKDEAWAAELSSRLLAELAHAGATRNVPAEHAIPHTLSLRFPGVSARALLHATNEAVAFSTGSACATTKDEPSHVLAAQGLDDRAIAESVRLSLGRFTTESDVDAAACALTEAVEQLRAVRAAA